MAKEEKKQPQELGSHEWFLASPERLKCRKCKSVIAAEVVWHVNAPQWLAVCPPDAGSVSDTVRHI